MFKKLIIALGTVVLANFALGSKSRQPIPNNNYVNSGAFVYGNANALLGNALSKLNVQSSGNMQNSAIKDSFVSSNIQKANQLNQINQMSNQFKNLDPSFFSGYTGN